jgi:hypothetical protein
MDYSVNRVEHIGMQLLQHKKITRDDIIFLGKYYRKESDNKLTREQLLNADLRTLTPGQKSRRTSILRYNM